jgi:hypothetical protein
VPVRAEVRRWVDNYEKAWRSPGTDGLGTLFAKGASYLQSPYSEPIVGLHGIAEMWDAERESPDEVFTIESEIVAIEEDTAVVRVLVRYGYPLTQEYLDLWILRFNKSGLCEWFEEWPYWAERPWVARD